ncbi:MAG: hypothetical protein AAGD32_06210 [Planctomycetota bacterium]
MTHADADNLAAVDDAVDAELKVPAMLLLEADIAGGIKLNDCSKARWKAAVLLEQTGAARIYHRDDGELILMCRMDLSAARQILADTPPFPTPAP